MYAYRPDRESHDICGNQYLVLGERMLCNGALLQRPSGSPMVVDRRLDGDRLLIRFQPGQVERQGIREGPLVQNQ